MKARTPGNRATAKNPVFDLLMSNDPIKTKRSSMKSLGSALIICGSAMRIGGSPVR